MKDSTLCLLHGAFYALITVVLVVGFSIIGWEKNGWDQWLVAGSAAFGMLHLVYGSHLDKKEQKKAARRRAASSEEDSW